MKQLLLGIPLLAISACTPQPSQPAGPTTSPAVQQVGYPAGSPSNTTPAFDGAYDGQFINNLSVGKTTLECPNLSVAPALQIRNGLAQFKAVVGTFQGYITPQGALTMQGERGQTFQGQIDPYYVLTGRVTGNCIYDTSWKRSKIY